MGRLENGNYISTVGPAGSLPDGGDPDYTTLALWESDAGADVASLGHAGYWAECYKGGNLGACDFQSWSDAATSTRYPKIYAAPNNGHNGSFTDGAYIEATQTGITVDLVACWIDGIRLKVKTVSGSGIDMAAKSTTTLYQVIENCIIHTDSTGCKTGLTMGHTLGADGSGNSVVIIRNNIIQSRYGNPGLLTGDAISLVCAEMNSDVSTVMGIVHNNTIVSHPSDTMANMTGIAMYVSTNRTLTAFVENNYISMETAGSNSLTATIPVSTGTLVKQARNNAQPDEGDLTSGGFNDDLHFPGHNTIINAPQTDQFNDINNDDYSLKEESVLIDGGKFRQRRTSYGLSWISAETTDITGAERDSWDIGAFEWVSGIDVIHRIKAGQLPQQGTITVATGGVNFVKRKYDTTERPAESVDNIVEPLNQVIELKNRHKKSDFGEI
jgi:hypothetical protein